MTVHSYRLWLILSKCICNFPLRNKAKEHRSFFISQRIRELVREVGFAVLKKGIIIIKYKNENNKEIRASADGPLSYQGNRMFFYCSFFNKCIISPHPMDPILGLVARAKQKKKWLKYWFRRKPLCNWTNYEVTCQSSYLHIATRFGGKLGLSSLA